MSFHLRKFHFTKIEDLLISSLVISFALAILDVIGVLYLNELGFSQSTIGFILTGVVIANILVKLLITPILEKFDEYKIYLYYILVLSLLYFMLFFISNIYFYVFVLVAGMVLISVGDNAFGIVFKDISPKSDFEKNESLLYGISNIAWFIAPLFAGLFLEQFSFKILFAIVSGIFFTSFLISRLIPIKNTKKRDKFDTNFFLNLKDYFKIKSNIDSYLFNFLVSFHYSFIFVFVLLEIEQYYGLFYSGLFVALTQLPLIFIQLKMSYFLKKYTSIYLIKYSLLVLALIYILCFFIPNFVVVVCILLLSAIPLSFLEPLRESYFFEHVEDSLDEEKYYPIYLTATDIGSIVSKISIGVILLFTTLHYAYLIFALVLFCSLFRIKN